MKIFALDVETTIHNKGDPFDERNSFVLGGYGTDTNYLPIVPRSLETLENKSRESFLDESSLVILFNAKFDLHWLRRIGYHIPHRLPIWDCQLAEYILSNQQLKYPSLEGAAIKYGLGHKLDVVKTEYWDKGIDTDQIPTDILETYLKQDISLTYQVYLKQKELFQQPDHAGKYKLFRLHCYDLLVLEEMEYNGYKFDTEGARKEALLLEGESEECTSKILSHFPDVPLNLGSPDHISVLLYGGQIIDEVRIPIGVYKTGEKVGLPRYKVVQQSYTLPQLIAPMKGTELAKEGYYGTGEDVLRSLSATGKVQEIIGHLLNRRGIEKLRSTYYNGIPDLIEKHHWAKSLVHGSLNQCVAATGRLTATKPNQQNMPGGCKKYCISRYEPE